MRVYVPRYFILVSPNNVMPNATPVLFTYIQEKDYTNGVYTAYSADEGMQEYCTRWLQKRYYPVPEFVNRFGYMSVDFGKIRDDDHLEELFNKVGIVNRETSK